MTYYVPDWDDKSNCLTVFDDTDLCHITKGGAYQHQQQLQQSYHHQHHQKNPASVLVPNHDALYTLMHTGIQEDEGTHSADRLECSSIPALDVPVAMSNTRVHEDEMLSWLRYPLDDSFDRNYCTEIFGEPLNPHVQLVKDVFLHQTMKESESTHVLNIEGNVGSEVGLRQLTNTVNTRSPPRALVKSDAAMALGAGRAAGLLSQTGLEAFNGVRTHSNPCVLLKSLSSPSMESSSDGKKAVQTMDPVTQAPPVSSGLNFSLFSRPVATTVDNLRLVGGASGPTNVERARQPFVKDSQLPCDPPTGDSNGSMAVSMPSSQQSTGFTAQGRTEKAGALYQGWYCPMSLPCGSVVSGHDKAGELNNRASCVSVPEKLLDTTEAVETTVSPSCLSGSSSGKVSQEVPTPSSKKASSLAQYSEDVEDVVAKAKKPPPGPRAVKRSRAAEVHNESEKKRRNKINVRLKALQSLIPNSNKTDKASVLDEAIEYTKMLQAQVQFMSMKTGMFIPTMMPSGMHYVPMQQMPTFSHMGMGIGMGMDMGIGGAGAGAAVNLSPTSHQPLSSQAYTGSQLVQTRSATGGLPTACISEPYKVMMPQQPLQSS